MRINFEEHHSKESQELVLSAQELMAISTLADSRLRKLEFRRAVKDFAKEAGDGSLDNILREANGLNQELPPPDKLARLLELVEERGEDVFPLFTALAYAQKAKQTELSGEDAMSDLTLARSAADKISGLPKAYVEDFRIEAILLGINSRISKRLKMPDLKELAKAVVADENEGFFKQCALALPEAKREEFLSYLPEAKRREAAILFDQCVSEVLLDSLASDIDDASQHGAVKDRVQDMLKAALNDPTEFSRPVVKALTETLANLESEDVKHILLEIGQGGMRRESSVEAQKDKNSHLARIIKELADIDMAKGGQLAMKFLGKKDVPNRLFKHVLRSLIASGYISTKADNYLYNDEELSILRRLFAEYPNQVNAVVETFYELRHKQCWLYAEKDAVFEALRDLGAITPTIFDRYRRADTAGRQELTRRINELKPRFFRNQPIDGILPEDQKILEEMVYQAYKPLNMSPSRVNELLRQLDDHTEDLEDFKFPEDGYDFAMADKRQVRLRPGESFVGTSLSLIRSKLAYTREADVDNRERKEKLLVDVLKKILKAGQNLYGEEKAVLLSIINDDEIIRNFVSRYSEINNDSAYAFLNELQEILGVYFKDHFGDRLANYLSANKSVGDELVKIMTSDKRRETMKKQLSGDGETIDWDKLDNTREIAKLISKFASVKIMGGFHEEIRRNLKKFTTEQGGEVKAYKGRLRAYISKNVGSFFAKASAGICTAEDVSLFEREDHFHINIVENDSEVRANIQAYIIDDNGGKSLVFRGFNPNADFTSKIDIASFCDKVLDIGRQFVADNGFKGLYITEQDGGWHALSNREEVGKYLISRYCKSSKERRRHLAITNNHSIDRIYEV